MVNAIKTLTDKQIEFICNACSITKDELFSMDEEALNMVYDTMCDIEIDEVCSADSDQDSERCEIASDIVTVLGNTLSKDSDDES